ncbi:MAG: L-dopachrome tautomerase-related protein [Pseudomonadota bacterium]
MTRVLLGFVVFFLLLALGVWLKFGGGTVYNDLNTPIPVDAPALDAVIAYDQPIGDIAFGSDGTMFFSVHPGIRTTDNQLLKVDDGVALPFPSPAAQQTTLGSVGGIATDGFGRIWVSDHGRFGFENPRLLAFDVDDGTLMYEFEFDSEQAGAGSFLQDIAVSADGQRVFIADTSLWRQSPALLVVDIEKRLAQRLLEDHPALASQQWQIGQEGNDLTFLGGILSIMPGIDSLTTSPDGNWLYLAAASHDGLFRIDLADKTLKPERYSDKPLSDSIAVTSGGRAFITDIEHNSIIQADGRRRLTTILRDARLRFPSALALFDNQLYVGESALPEAIRRDDGDYDTIAPFRIYRVSL